VGHAEYRFIKEDSQTEASIPALTAVGFAHWLTLQILAYPEDES